MISYSVVFNENINLLRLRHWCFLGNLRIFKTSQSKEQEWPAASVSALLLNWDNLWTGYEQLSHYQFNRNYILCVILYKQNVDSYYVKSPIKTYQLMLFLSKKYDSYYSMFTWDLKWTQTDLESQTDLKIVLFEWRFHCGNFPNQSLRVNYWEIIRETSKCQMDFLDKTCKIRSKLEKVNIIIEFYIFEVVLTPNFSLNWQFWIFGTN